MKRRIEASQELKKDAHLALNQLPQWMKITNAILR
jgi:hypothetical protein